MFKVKTGQSLADLEEAVAHAKEFLDETIASHRHARIDLGIAADELAESETPANHAAHRAALAASRATSQAKVGAARAVADAKLALELARTRPVRAETAKLPAAAAEAITNALPGLRLALAQMVEALDRASFPEIAGVSRAATLFAQMVHNANQAVAGGDAELFCEELRAYAQGVLDGTKPATLGPTFEEQRRQVA